MLDLNNRIVEFLLDGDLHFGVVTESAVSKIQLTDANGRNRRLAARYLMVTHPVQTSLAEFHSTLETVKSRVEALLAEVDTELLWEAIGSRSGALDKLFLAREYFGDEESYSQSAVLRAAISDPVHFRVKGVEIYSRNREQVEQQIHQREVEQEREARWIAVSRWLTSALLESEMEAFGEGFEAYLDATEEFLLSKHREAPAFLTEAEPEIWKRTPALRDFTPREAAFQLLICAGRLPEDSDPLLVIAGVNATFSALAEEAAGALTPFSENRARRDLQHLDAFAVDDSETLEVDDAITLEATEIGWMVGVHIADVAHFIEPASALYEEACSRMSSLYLPHRLLTMLPARLSCDLASLQEGGLRPVISTLVEVDSNGGISNFQICRSQIRVRKRLTYDQVDQQLSSEGYPWSRLAWFSELLRKQRLEQGAISFSTPEYKVRVDDRDQISVVRLDSDSTSRTMIAELMILTNSLAARFAQQEGLALIYRSQKPPRKELKIPTEYDPVALVDVFRSLERSQYGLAPEPHAGLGVTAYAQTTSPLRRLSDLLSQMQISAYLQDNKTLLSEEELQSRISQLGETERNLRAVERRATSHYVLKYLWEECRQESLQAVVLGPADRGFQVELSDYPLRARLLSGKARPEAGQRIQVKMERLDLDKGILSVRSD